MRRGGRLGGRWNKKKKNEIDRLGVDRVEWSAELNRWFRGANVVILPDNDAAGREHIHAVTRQIAGTAASVRIVDLNADIKLPPKGDVEQWLERGGTAARLLALVEEAPEATFEAEPEPEVKTKTNDDGDDYEGQILSGHPCNTRLALKKLGVSLRYNAFAAEIEISGLEGWGPEVTDATAIRLRFRINEKFPFLPTQMIFDQVLIDEAHLHRYHFVCDCLDGLKAPRILRSIAQSDASS